MLSLYIVKYIVSNHDPPKVYFHKPYQDQNELLLHKIEHIYIIWLKLTAFTKQKGGQAKPQNVEYLYVKLSCSLQNFQQWWLTTYHVIHCLEGILFIYLVSNLLQNMLRELRDTFSAFNMFFRKMHIDSREMHVASRDT